MKIGKIRREISKTKNFRKFQIFRFEIIFLRNLLYSNYPKFKNQISPRKMAFFKKRGGNRGGRGGNNNFNSRNPNKVFRRNPNHPGGIRKNSGGQDNSEKPFRSNRPLNKRNFRGRRVK